VRRGVRLLFNKYRADKDSWNLYRQTQRIYRKEIWMARKIAWWICCSSIDDVRTSSRLHRALCRDPRTKLGSLWFLRADLHRSRGKY